jgi:hypothetical protein
MHEPRDSSLGRALGGIAVAGGVVWLGLGFAAAWKGRGPDGVDGLLFGGLALVAGCVILWRRARVVESKQDESGRAGPDAAPDPRAGDTLHAGDGWVCAFCGEVARGETAPRPLCESRTCRCGAVGLANRACDFDEITDDAIGLFGVVTRPESRGDDLALRQDILRAGVEIRPGVVREVEAFSGRRESIHHVWFRRSGTVPAG